jgi:hypothetical protein
MVQTIEHIIRYIVNPTYMSPLLAEPAASDQFGGFLVQTSPLESEPDLERFLLEFVGSDSKSVKPASSGMNWPNQLVQTPNWQAQYCPNPCASNLK